MGYVLAFIIGGMMGAGFMALFQARKDDEE